VLPPWLDSTFTARTAPPMAMARPMTTAMINRSTTLPFLAFGRSGVRAFGLDSLGQGTVNVTWAARPVSFLKLTGSTVAWYWPGCSPVIVALSVLLVATGVPPNSPGPCR
jgi:hypothetical protein